MPLHFYPLEGAITQGNFLIVAKQHTCLAELHPRLLCDRRIQTHKYFSPVIKGANQKTSQALHRKMALVPTMFVCCFLIITQCFL